MDAQLRKLRRHYLGFKKSATGTYNERQLSFGAAFTVFAHGEIESFFESWSHAILNEAESLWKAGRYSRALAALLTFGTSTSLPEQAPSTDVWTEPCVRAIRTHRAVIEKNHGVKEAHICRMLIPLGFDVRNIDSILLADLAAFASIRGNHAHQSYKQHLGQQFDPFDRGAKVEKLRQLLSDLDDELNGYFRSL